MDAEKPGGEEAEILVGKVVVRDSLQKLLERHRRRTAFVGRETGLRQVVVRHADGVHEVEQVLAVDGVGRDGQELCSVNRPAAAAAHLREKGAGPDVAHEQQALDRFDVGAGSDHIDSDRNSRIEIVAE